MRASKWFVAFVGQSLNVRPVPPGAYPDLLMVNYPHVAWRNFGIGGASWTELAGGTGDAAGRPASSWLHPYLKAGLNCVMVCVGGTADLHDEGNSGATTYADYWAFTDAAPAARSGPIVVATTITPASYFTVGQEHARSDAGTGANALILADASSKFDYKIDLAGVSGLDDYTSANYVDDGGGVRVHWSTAGATLAAVGPSSANVKATLDSIIPSADR